MNARRRSTVQLRSRVAKAVAFAAVAGILFSPGAIAGGHKLAAATNAAWKSECGSCHVAYPPGLLPAASWRRIMSGLDNHYGTDASLDAATVQRIGEWLQVHAGTYKRVREQPSEDRITRSEWFVRKHREIAATVWTLPSVRSPANCAACHGGAEQGRFGERELRVPEGVPPSQRRAWND
jgi:hypothetical protein